MIEIQEKVQIAPYTTFNIGGPAKYFVSVKNAGEVQEALHWARENNAAVFVMGGGSNILVSDDGFDGLVVYLEKQNPIVDGASRRITCFSGCTLESLLNTAQESGLAGMEKMAGIPGTVGGAVRGNAGAFGTEIKDVIFNVRAINRESGQLHEFSSEQCDYSYRSSIFKKNTTWIVVDATFQFSPGDADELKRVMEETKKIRNDKHNQKALCAGSFFINPVVESEALRKEFEEESGTKSRGNKVPAGWLIDKVELRGKQIGGAMISQDHPNYIINTGDATAENVIMLVSIVKQKVRDTYNIELHKEVQYVGF